MRATKISITSAHQDKLFYFVANVVVYRASDQRCLILERSPHEKVHPGKYCVPGGKLEWNDLDLAHPTRYNGDVIDFEGAAEKLLVREVQEEAGIKIEPTLRYLNSNAFIRPDEIPVVLVKFAAQYKSGDVVPERGAFTNFAWVNVEEVKQYDCIQGINDEIVHTIQLFARG